MELWRDEDVYLGTQLPKGDGGRYYGLSANEEYQPVAEEYREVIDELLERAEGAWSLD